MSAQLQQDLLLLRGAAVAPVPGFSMKLLVPCVLLVGVGVIAVWSRRTRKGLLLKTALLAMRCLHRRLHREPRNDD